MTTTDRTGADTAPAPDLSVAERARLDRIESTPACDEDTVERVARAMHEVPPRPGGFRRTPWNELAEGRREAYRDMTRAAIAALKPAPGTAVDNMAAEFHAEGDAMTFAVNPPPDSLITVMADDARLLLSIHADGTVDGSVEDASEAAGIFVREIRRLIQQQPALGTNSSGQMVVDVLRNGEHVATLDAVSGSVTVDTSGQADEELTETVLAVFADWDARDARQREEDSGQAMQRVLDLADELGDSGHRLASQPDLYSAGRGDAQMTAAARIRAAVAGPQRDGVTDA